MLRSQSQPQLCACRPAEGRSGHPRAPLGKPCLPLRDAEHLRDLFSVDSFAAHALAEAGVVELAAAHPAEPVQDLVLLPRNVPLKPKAEV